MALKRLRYTVVAILILFVIATLAILYTRTIAEKEMSQRDDKFTDVFIEMAVAREMVGDNPDSLESLYREIFNSYNVDSAWIMNYISDISNDAEKHRLIWDRILVKLDSLRDKPGGEIN